MARTESLVLQHEVQLVTYFESKRTIEEHYAELLLPSVGGHVGVGPILQQGFGQRIHIVEVSWRSDNTN
jgi:hypothetical protein